MAQRITVRQLTVKEFQAIAPQLTEFCAPLINLRGRSGEPYDAQYLDEGVEYPFVAYDGKKPAGFCIVKDYDREVTVSRLDLICVAKEYRKITNTFKLLMDAVQQFTIQRALNKKFKEAYITLGAPEDELIAMYRKLGFELQPGTSNSMKSTNLLTTPLVLTSSAKTSAPLPDIVIPQPIAIAVNESEVVLPPIVITQNIDVREISLKEFQAIGWQLSEFCQPLNYEPQHYTAEQDTIFVAFYGNKPVGFIVGRNYDMYYKERSLTETFIDIVCVAPKYRKVTNTFELLMDAVQQMTIRRALSRKTKEANITLNAATLELIPVYEKIGFERGEYRPMDMKSSNLLITPLILTTTTLASAPLPPHNPVMDITNANDGARTPEEESAWYAAVINDNRKEKHNTVRELVFWVFKRIQWEQRYIVPFFFRPLRDLQKPSIVNAELAELEQLLFPMQQDMSNAWRSLIDVTVQPEQYALLEKLYEPTELSLFWRLSVCRILIRFLVDNSTYKRLRGRSVQQAMELSQRARSLETELSQLGELYREMGYDWKNGLLSLWLTSRTQQDLDKDVIRAEAAGEPEKIIPTKSLPPIVGEMDYVAELNSMVWLPIEKQVRQLVSVEVQLRFSLERFLELETTLAERRNPVALTDASSLYRLMRELKERDRRMVDPMSPELQQWLEDKLISSTEVRQATRREEQEELGEFTSGTVKPTKSEEESTVPQEPVLTVSITQPQTDAMLRSIDMLPRTLRYYLQQNHSIGELLFNMVFVVDVLSLMYLDYRRAWAAKNAKISDDYANLFELVKPFDAMERRWQNDHELILQYGREGSVDATTAAALRELEVAVEFRDTKLTPHDESQEMSDGSTSWLRRFVEDWSTLGRPETSSSLSVLTYMDAAILARQRIDVANACAGLIEEKQGDADAVDWIAVVGDSVSATQSITEDLLIKGERVLSEKFSEYWVARLSLVLKQDATADEYVALRRKQLPSTVEEDVGEELDNNAKWAEEFYTMRRRIALVPVCNLISGRTVSDHYLELKALNLHALPGYGSITPMSYSLLTAGETSDPSFLQGPAIRGISQVGDAILPETQPSATAKIALDTRVGREDIDRLMFAYKLLGVAFSALYEMMDTIGPEGQDDVYTFRTEETWIADMHLPVVRRQERIILSLFSQRTRDLLDARNLRKEAPGLILTLPQASHFKPSLTTRLIELNLQPNISSSTSGRHEGRGDLDILLEYSSIFIGLLEKAARVASEPGYAGGFRHILELINMRQGDQLRSRVSFLTNYTNLLDGMLQSKVSTRAIRTASVLGEEEEEEMEEDITEALLRATEEEEGMTDIVTAEDKAVVFSKFILLLIDRLLDDDRRSLYQRLGSTGGAEEGQRYSARAAAAKASKVKIGQVNEFLEGGDKDEERSMVARMPEKSMVSARGGESEEAEKMRRELLAQGFRTTRERAGVEEKKLLGELSREFDVQLTLYMEERKARARLYPLLDAVRELERAQIDENWSRNLSMQLEQLRDLYEQIKKKTAYKLAFGLALNANERWIGLVRTLKRLNYPLEQLARREKRARTNNDQKELQFLAEQKRSLEKSIRRAEKELTEAEEEVRVTLLEEKAIPESEEDRTAVISELRTEGMYDTDLMDVTATVQRRTGIIEGASYLQYVKYWTAMQQLKLYRDELNELESRDVRTGANEVTMATLRRNIEELSNVPRQVDVDLQKFIDDVIREWKVLPSNVKSIKNRVLKDLGLTVAEEEKKRVPEEEQKTVEITEIEEIERGATVKDDDEEETAAERNLDSLRILRQRDPTEYYRRRTEMLQDRERQLNEKIAAIEESIAQELEEEQEHYPHVLVMVRMLVAYGRIARVRARPQRIMKLRERLRSTQEKLSRLPAEAAAAEEAVREQQMIQEAEIAMVKIGRTEQRSKELEDEVYLFLLNVQQWKDIVESTANADELAKLVNLILIPDFPSTRHAAVRDAARRAVDRYLTHYQPSDQAASDNWWNLLRLASIALQNGTVLNKVSQLQSKYSRLNVLDSKTEKRFQMAYDEAVTILMRVLNQSNQLAREIADKLKDRLSLLTVRATARIKELPEEREELISPMEVVEEQSKEEEEPPVMLSPRRKRKLIPESPSPEKIPVATFTGREPGTPLRTKITRTEPLPSDLPELEESGETDEE